MEKLKNPKLWKPQVARVYILISDSFANMKVSSIKPKNTLHVDLGIFLSKLVCFNSKKKNNNNDQKYCSYQIQVQIFNVTVVLIFN